MNQFNLRLKELRTEKNVYQKEIANQIKKTTDTISAYEKGKAEPSIDMLIKLADYFQVSVDYLIGRENEQGGIIINDEFNVKERELIGYYRILSAFEQGQLIGVAKTMAHQI